LETENEIHKPLGQGRKKPARIVACSFDSGRWILIALAALLLAASTMTALHHDPLLNQRDIDDRLRSAEAGKAAVADDAVAKRSSGTRTAASRPEVTRPDVPVRENGPVVISRSDIASADPRLAHLPVEDLLEQTAFGKLPVVAADGRRPVDVYARPWSGTRGTRIAIVVGGLGLSQTGTQYAIETLPEEVTLAFAASGNSLQRWLQEALRNGHEVLLQIPFEPFGYPETDPGPHTVLVADGSKKNIEDLHWAMGRITNYTGIMNFMGARFLSDPQAMEPVMKDIAGRGILFLDDGTSAQTLTAAMAQQYGVPYAGGDGVVDTELDKNAILKRLDEVERIARRNGEAIASASAFRVSVDAIAGWVQDARSHGVEIVGVSALAH